jgi:hypothetical protein
MTGYYVVMCKMNIHLHYDVEIRINKVILKKNSDTNKAVICDGEQDIASYSLLEFIKFKEMINMGHRWKKAREAGN